MTGRTIRVGDPKKHVCDPPSYHYGDPSGSVWGMVGLLMGWIRVWNGYYADEKSYQRLLNEQKEEVHEEQGTTADGGCW